MKDRGQTKPTVFLFEWRLWEIPAASFFGAGRDFSNPKKILSKRRVYYAGSDGS